MSYDIRIRLTPTERVQCETDIDRITSKLGQLPYKHMILPALHVYADALDQLDSGALAALVNGTTKEMRE